MKRKILAYILIVTVAMSFGSPCMAQTSAASQDATVGDSKAIHLGMNVRTITVPNGKGQLITVPAACKTVSVGNPLVCDIVMLGEKDFLLVGKQPGETNVYVWLANDMKLESTIKVFDSTEALIDLLEDILPYESDIKVSMAHNTVILSGYVMKPTSIDDAQRIAEAYMAGRETTKQIDVKVVNMLKVKNEKQIMLEVRFAEVVRTTNEDRGLDWRYTGDIFGSPADLSFLEGGTPQYHGGSSANLVMPSQNGAQGTSPGGMTWDGGQSSFAYGLEWLEENGLGKVIAKPNLLVRNGEEASFLAGGEFPVPVQQEDSVQIEWKEFGVKLSFTPLIDERDNIHLSMIPEVSVLDFSEASVSVNGFNIPALKTRRTETKVVLQEGQSFYVSGLISQSETDSFSKVPGIDTVPIIGQLFRKKENALSETELIIFVTPRIVDPIAAAQKRKEFNDRKRMELLTNTEPVPFEQAHGDNMKDFIEQYEKPDKSLEQIRQEEIEAELARLLAEAEAKKAAEQQAKQNKKKKKKVKKTSAKVDQTAKKVTADKSKKKVVEIRNDELAAEHKVVDLSGDDVIQKDTTKKKKRFSLFKRKKSSAEPVAMDKNDILAANSIADEGILDGAVSESVQPSLTIASSEDITSTVSQDMTYLDDISEELHELSALKG